jgi:hypothetical protein
MGGASGSTRSGPNTSGRVSVFQPIVQVDAQGRVDIDWCDSYIWDVDSNGEETPDGVPVGDLDPILGSGPEWKRLRRLARTLRRQERRRAR